MARELKIPNGMTLETILAPMPDEPLPSIDGFDHLTKTHEKPDLEKLNEWIEAQSTISVILKWHGQAGLDKVLRGIALASSAKKVHMTPRIRSIAAHYGFEIY